MLCLYTLQLNCFAMNSTVIFDKQSGKLIFYAWLKPTLPAKEKATCLSLINLPYYAKINIGDAIFISTQQIYQPNLPLDLSLTCVQGFEPKCTFANIKLFKIANFQLNFLTSDYQIQGTAGKFQMLWFDRTQCFKDNSITFSLESGKEYMKLNYNPQNCLSRPDDDDLKFTFVQNDEILDTRILSLATLVSDGNITGLNDYSQSLASYKLDCRESGTLNTDCLNFVTKFIFDDLAKNSQMMQSCFFVTKDGVAYEYFQTIVLYFHIYRPDFNDGCFSQVGLTIFKNMIQLTATPGALTNCSNAIFEQYFPHTATNSVIGVSATDDHSGAYQKLTKIYNNTFPYGTNIDMFIGCSQFDEPSKCLDTLQAIDNMPDNSSVVMTHYFLAADGSFVQKLSFPVEFTQSLFDQIDVQIFDNEICLIVVIAKGFGIQQMLSTTISITNGDVQQNVSKDILFKASEKEYCIKLESNLFRQFAKDDPDTLSAIISYESGRMPAESIIFYTKPANVQYMWVPIIINAVLCVLSIYLLQKCGCL
ncbi:Conserved_hypothetical protein [Hexamita inflata]|uniref:Transmembrane protein n=1 Tax=Hexamita inflata TaxID=28002 RepID=A0AA86UA44_9EUKA|nr:Conserved hypothetical protein [Hexamita inflata]CAI9963451.1 Conserved hypothetical protein [Hexamita inflata]